MHEIGGRVILPCHYTLFPSVGSLQKVLCELRVIVSQMMAGSTMTYCRQNPITFVLVLTN